MSAIEVDCGTPIQVELDVGTITSSESGLVITYEGVAGKYGLVFATHNLTASDPQETKGHFSGFVQAIDDSGVVDRSATSGLWKRSGTKLRVYGMDDDDVARILWVGDVDLRAKTFRGAVWEMDS